MAEWTFTDINGKKHKQLRVRSMGSGQGYGVLDVLTNSFIDGPYKTRAEAHERLQAREKRRTRGAGDTTPIVRSGY